MGLFMVIVWWTQGSDNSGAIIFIDELDAVGTKRFDSEASGDREVQRTMLELLNQLDGFSSEDRIKVSHLRAETLMLFPLLKSLATRATCPPFPALSCRYSFLQRIRLRNGCISHLWNS